MTEKDEEIISLKDLAKDNKSINAVADSTNSSKPKPKANKNTNANTTQQPQYKKVNINDMVPHKEHITPEKEYVQKELKLIDDNIERTKKDLLDNVINPFKDACIAESLKDQGAEEIDDNDGDEDLEAEISKVNNENKLKEESFADSASEEVETSKDDDLNDFLKEDSETEEEIIPMADDNIQKTIEDPKPVVEETPVPKQEVKPEVEKEVVEEKSTVEIQKPKELKSAPEIKAPAPDVSDDHFESISDKDLKEFLDADSSAEAIEDEDDKAKRESILNDFKKDVFDKLKISSDIKDGKAKIKSFRISTKPVSVNKVLRSSSEGSKANRATWALPNTNRLITFSALSGEEIENLSPDNHDQDMSADMANRLIFNTIYDHLIDPTKPASMEEWLKTINWFDNTDVYFGIYLATFKSSNYVTYACTNPKCNNLFLNEVDYKKMIQYTDDKAKERYRSVFKNAIDATPDEIEEEVVPINDKFAIGFRAPSIFDIIFGTSTLDQTFINKYAATIGNISYMGNIYYIKENTLYPVDCKPVKNNMSKTMKNKIIAYYNILKTFSPDEYSVVSRSIADINTKNRVMATFKYPNAVCPKCGTEIKMDSSVNPLSMLFTRHQLVQFASFMTV